MVPMTREQMIAEFGEPGVQNPMIVDLIAWDSASARVILTMIERRPWGSHSLQFRQIEEKINRYLGYVLDGHLGQHYPQYVGKPVCIHLDCVDAPTGEAERFVAAAGHAIRTEGVEFTVNVLGPEADV
ncbi:MAG: hypothetical protein FJW27_05275 [Acidimicrobiia bacterium]|nr:hypothetical protein [Acidimicrobiia bacterium]